MSVPKLHQLVHKTAVNSACRTGMRHVVGLGLGRELLVKIAAEKAGMRTTTSNLGATDNLFFE